MSLLARPGLMLIKVMMQAELKYKVPHYTMILNIDGNQVLFEYPTPEGKTMRTPYPDKKGVLMAKVTSIAKKEMAKYQISKESKLEVIILKYPEHGDIEIEVYYVDPEGFKQIKKTTL